MSAFYISENPRIEEASSREVVVLLAGGELDFAASPQLRDAIAGQLKVGSSRLVLDLSDVTFIDSTAIGVLVGASGRLREAGGSLAVVCTHPKVLQIFDIAGLEHLLALCYSREEAVAALAPVG